MPPPVRAAAAQVAAGVPAAKPSHYAGWGHGKATYHRIDCTFLSHVCGGCKRVGHLEGVCKKAQRHLAPRLFTVKMDRGNVVSQPLPHAKGGERDPATSSRATAKAAIRRDFNAGKRSHGKGRQEQFAKTMRMTIAALDKNRNDQDDQACAIATLKDDIACQNEEMDDAERSKHEAIRKPHVSTSTSALPHAMFVVDKTSVDVPCDVS